MPEHFLPLEDIKVLDCTGGMAGSFCTKLLAGLGAEVVAVEPPGAGSPLRSAGPFAGDDAHPEKSAAFLYLNTAKKGITLDLDNPKGASIFRRLAEGSDILVESFPPGYMDSLRLGYETLENLNPGLIYTSITPFGQTGPYRDYKTSDMVAQAMGALMYTIGLPEREPLKIGGNTALYTTGMCAFSGAMLALHVRDDEGYGQHVDISAMETMTVAQIHATIHHQFGRVPSRRESTLVRAADGWVSPGLDIGVREDTWTRVCELIGLPDLADNPAFNTREARREHQQDLLAIIEEWTSTRPKEEIYHTLQELRTVAGYVAAADDMFTSGQLVDRDFFQSVDHPFAGEAMYPGVPFTIGDSPGRHTRAPLLGEHNAEVYGGRLGYTDEELAGFRGLGVI